MRPGITIQHARERSNETALVRSDITGFIGIIPKAKWPRGCLKGDFVELPLSSWAELADSPVRKYIDPVTVRAVRNFFVNGGELCRLIGLAVESEQDLMTDNPFEVTFYALLDRLRAEEDLGLLVMPVLSYLPVSFDRMGRPSVPYQPTIELLIEHCREMNNRFLILDTPRDLHDEALLQWVSTLQDSLGKNASYAAVYYPWLMDGDDTFPPSGSIAGVYARTELEHAPFGVKWPPANQVVRGVTHPAVPVRWRESDQLIAAHINPILTQPSRGVVVWGARTLSRDPKWMHVNSRRIVSMISEQVRRDSEWVVFENQRPELWRIVERTVSGRLDMVWSAGLLTGDKAGLDYEVQCNSELNPPEVRNAGQINVRIMMRPISTAEFIVVELRLGS
jgi:hypothetical protein